MVSRFSSSVAVAAVTLGLVLGAAHLPSTADDDPPVRVAELADPVSFPVVHLALPVITPKWVTSDLERTQEISESESELDVVLDSTVLFGKDSDVLLPEAGTKLKGVADALMDKGPGAVRIVGHTDDLGSAAHGYRLSERRAAAVEKVLAPQLSGFTITTEGKGEDEPRVPNVDEESRAQNRRVEIHYERN